MAISATRVLEAAESIAAVEGVYMDADALLEDAFNLAYAFPDESDFLAACRSTCRVLEQLVRHSVSASSLKYEFAGWRSLHYQHRVGQGLRADCRIVFRDHGEGVEVKGFGHRWIPGDIYERMSATR